MQRVESEPCALLVGSETRVVVTVARSLAAHGVRVHAGDFLPGRCRFRSTAIERILSLGDASQSHQHAANSLNELVARYHYDTIIPCSDSALVVLSDIAHTLTGGVRVACPPPEVVRSVLDKQQTLDAAAKCGVPVPRQWRIRGLEELGSVAATLEFPLVSKPLSKAFESPYKVRYFENLDSLQREFRENLAFGENYLLQRYVRGQGVGIEVLVADGQPVAMFQHRRLAEFPSSGGVSVKAIAEPLDERLTEYSLAVLRELRWEGVAMVEFRHDSESGEAALMEVNGRYWGSLALSRTAGIEFPWYEWQVRHGDVPRPPLAYRTDVGFSWFLGALRTAMGQKNRGLVRSGVANHRFRDALWSWRDPAPWVCEISNFLTDQLEISTKRAYRAWTPEVARRVLSGFRAKRAVRIEARRLGLRESITESEIRVLRHIVFVCAGNIMRSALAEALLKTQTQLHDALMVESAGVTAKSGRPADSRVIDFALSRGVDMSEHRSRHTSEIDLEHADIVFVMDYENARVLLAQRPDLKNKVVLLMAVSSPGRRSNPIMDPFRLDSMQCSRTLTVIENCARKLSQILND